MRKSNCNTRWKLSSLLVLALMLLGITSAKADKYDLTLGQKNTPAANDYYLFTPNETGYLLIAFDKAIDMTGNEGVFFTYVGGWEDTVQDAAVCNGTPTGKTGSVVYCGGTYTEYTGVTKVAYKVNSGTSYCIWGGTISIQLAPFTATFSTTEPDLNGGGGSTEPVDFNKFTLTPEGPYEEIWGLTYTWDYPVQILDESLIYIQAPDYTEYTGGNGLNCSVQGNSLIIDVVNGPLKNHTAYEAWTWIGIREGAISVNGQTLNETLEQMITWQPGGTVIPDPVTVPAWGTTAYTSEISEIILSWPGFCVASDTGNKLLSNLDDDIEIWVGPKGVKYDGGSGYTKLAVKSVEGVGTPTQKVWYPSMKVTLSQPFTDVDKGLTLVIPSWNLLFTEEGDGDTYESQPERIDLYFCVAKDIVLPGQMQRVNLNNFKGLEIMGGNYTVKDASKIALYKGWFDEVDFKIAGSTPVAYGVNNSTSDEIIIGFDTDYSTLWSGAYTILVPPGAIEGFTVPKGTESANPENQIQFTITGNNAPITAMAVGTNPEPGVVDQIDKVQIWWGGYNRLMHASNPEDPETGAGSAIVNGTMAVNGGQPTDIAFVITKKLIETAQDEDTGQGDGVDYEYSLVYTPAAPITTPGKYTFTIPANQVRVYYNSFSEPLNDEVVVEYTIEGQATDYLQVAMGPNMDDIVANPATDTKLLPDGQGGFSGVIEVEKTGNQAFFFYSTDADGKMTYYSGEYGGFGANWKMDFSNETSYAYDDVMEWKKSNKGSWTVTGYPAGFVGGEITAVVTLPEGDNPGSASFSFKGTQEGTPDLPEELYVLLANDNMNWMSYTSSPASFKLGEDGTYEGDFNTGDYTLFKFFGIDNGTKTWYASQPLFEYEKIDFSEQATYTYNTITTAVNSALGVGGWDVAANTDIHVVVDLVNKTIVLSKAGGSVEPEPVYMTGAEIDPANNSRMDNMGIVTITWPQYRLDLGDTPDRTAVNLPTDKIKVYLNGEEMNTASLMGMDWKALNAATTNEGAGGSDESPLAEILFYPGNACFFWSGTLNIKIDEGVVTTTTGEINPAFDLTYYLGGKDVISPCVFDPEDGAIFYVGEDNKVTMSWPEVYNDNGTLYHGAYQATGIEAGKAFYDTYDEDGNRTRINVPGGAMTIVDGNVVLDISDLPVGVYSLTVGQGAIMLGEDAINAEIYYNFSIEEKEVPADPTESDIDPTITLDPENNIITISYDGNDLEITDDWSLTITDSEGNVTNVPADKVSIDDKGNLVIDLNELGLEGAGNYTLILGEYSVLIDEDGTITYNPALVYEFKTSAIAILTADGSKSWKVYNMNGMNVLNTDNAGDLNQLEKGLYIINGKKVLVK